MQREERTYLYEFVMRVISSHIHAPCPLLSLQNWVVAVTTEAGWTASDTRVIIGRRGAKYAKYSGGATAETVSVPLFDLAGMLVDAMETSMGDGFIDVSIVARVFDGSIGAESPVPSHSSEGINDKDPHVAWAVDRSGNTTRPLRIVGRPVEMTEYNLAFQVWFPTPQVQWGTGKSRPTATTATGTAEATPISLQTPVSLSTAADHLTAVVSATFEVTPTISSTNTATVESPLAASKIDAIASLEPQPTTRPDYYYDDPNWVERDRLNAARAASVYSIIVEFGANEHGLKVHIAVD